jgi:hypothetical protein
MESTRRVEFPRWVVVVVEWSGRSVKGAAGERNRRVSQRPDSWSDQWRDREWLDANGNMLREDSDVAAAAGYESANLGFLRLQTVARRRVRVEWNGMVGMEWMELTQTHKRACREREREGTTGRANTSKYLLLFFCLGYSQSRSAGGRTPENTLPTYLISIQTQYPAFIFLIFLFFSFLRSSSGSALRDREGGQVVDWNITFAIDICFFVFLSLFVVAFFCIRASRLPWLSRLLLVLSVHVLVSDLLAPEHAV